MRGDLLTLCEHALTDISFEGEGSYNLGDNDNNFDPLDAGRAVRAITYIKNLVRANDKKINDSHRDTLSAFFGKQK